MQAQVDAYDETMLELKKKVIPMGGFWWQLMKSSMYSLATKDEATCKKYLQSQCVPKPSAWNHLGMYNIPGGGKNVNPQGFTDYTAEFLLTRGPYGLLGYSWCGCTNGQQARPRAKEWDEDFGEPIGGAACSETGADTGVFQRKWTKATVTWDCKAGHGKITSV
eukprot:TRINITY_DN1115_c0_g1_i1.p1 TRINITY_DN1115_c0_g1~~TRINITY_DN1115_c0_g1_i1.p1  ORF type:complete len:164 (+),score=20.64 TRINITY_DN1115_c0_g1_i1:728-1219(+)